MCWLGYWGARVFWCNIGSRNKMPQPGSGVRKAFCSREPACKVSTTDLGFHGLEPYHRSRAWQAQDFLPGKVPAASYLILWQLACSLIPCSQISLFKKSFKSHARCSCAPSDLQRSCALPLCKVLAASSHQTVLNLPPIWCEGLPNRTWVLCSWLKLSSWSHANPWEGTC